MFFFSFILTYTLYRSLIVIEFGGNRYRRPKREKNNNNNNNRVYIIIMDFRNKRKNGKTADGVLYTTQIRSLWEYNLVVMYLTSLIVSMILSLIPPPLPSLF